MDTSDPDKVVWQIFAPVTGGAFVCMGVERCYTVMEMALGQAYEDLNLANGAYLCSFKFGDFKPFGETFKTLSSFKLSVKGEVVSTGCNGGSLLINLLMPADEKK